MARDITVARNLPEEYGSEYSDEALLQMIKTIHDEHLEWKEIYITFLECENNIGEVAFVFGNRPYRMSEQRMVRMHRFSLTEYEWGDWTKEVQREKRLIQRHFPKIKVTSDLR